MGRVIASWDELVSTLNEVRRGRKVVFTNGCFDILHVGHVRFLRDARAQGDLLVIGVNTDASVKKLKGPERPLNDERSRAEVLAALASVDFVTIFDEETPANIIQTVRPDVLVKGGDWTVENIIGAPFVQSYGGEVYSLKYIDGFSTTAIVEKMKRK